MQLEESGHFYTILEAQNINSFENGLKGTKDINFSITEKRKWNKLPNNQPTFYTYYNFISASYGRLQIQGDRGGRSYGNNPYEFTRKYGTFVTEAHIYLEDQWRKLSLKEKEIQEMKIR